METNVVLSKKERRKIARMQKRTENVSQVEKVDLANVDITQETVENVEPTTAQLATVEAKDNVVKLKDTLLAIVTTFSLALTSGIDVLKHLVPIENVDKVESWSTWLTAFKELFVTYLASLVSPERLIGERVTISAERWKPFVDFCT